MTLCSTPTRTTSRPAVRLAAVTAAAGLITLGLAAPASAHVSVSASDSGAGAYTVLTFSVPHGCDGSSTTKIAISIPDGINSVTPTRNPYYTVAKKSQALDPALEDAHGNEITERISVVTYTAKTPLKDGFRDTMELSVQLPDAAGETLTFPVVQTCVKGETAWTEVAAEGEDSHDLDHPAPQVTITEAAAAHGDEGTTHSEADEAERRRGRETDETAATTLAPVSTSTDDSSNGLAIGGLVAGVLGLLAGGAALARSGRKA